VVLTLATVVFRAEPRAHAKAEERTQQGELLSADAAPLLDPEVLSPPPNDRSRRAP
jgi:hypothetical protein